MGKSVHKGLYAFAAVFLALCLLPLVGMLWTSSEPTSDEDTLSTFPQTVSDDGSMNLYFFQGVGDYFEDRFAYRSAAIDLNARLRAGILKTSPTEQVIVGNDGWLYYGGTMNDYRGLNQMSEREALNIAHNLALMQGYSRAMGAEFLFTIAPNKNSLYPNHMPYYYPQAQNENMELLGACLEEKDVNYVNLFELFRAEDEELYCKTDTHWNTEGALLVAQAFLEASDKDLAAVSSTTESQMVGDISRMLYPTTATTEASLQIETGSWKFTSGSESVEDDIIHTTSSGGEGALLMYRDSFANTLIPYLAPEFSQAQFSKMIPYNLTEVPEYQPDVVIIERAERHIDLLGEEPPFMFAPTAGIERGGSVDSDSWISWYQEGDFRVIEGCVDEDFISTEDDIFLVVRGSDEEETTFVPYHISISSEPTGESDTISEYGFRLYLNDASLTDDTYTISLIVLKAQDGTANQVKTITLSK